MPESLSNGGSRHQPDNTTDLIRDLEGDKEEARDKLIGYSYGRLRRLARRMLRNYPAARLQVESGDVLHPALMRLHRALATVTPANSRHFWNLAALQIRRELLDIVRNLKNKMEIKLRPAGNGSDAEDDLAGQPDATGEPTSLDGWTRFHELIGKLPEDQREVFYLVWYDWLTQEQAAEVLGVSLRTVRRRWLSARMTVTQWMCGERLS